MRHHAGMRMGSVQGEVPVPPAHLARLDQALFDRRELDGVPLLAGGTFEVRVLSHGQRGAV